MSTYVCFLRGINVGGKMVPMQTLSQMFESLSFTKVKTILNSGNVVFDSKETLQVKIKESIETAIQKTFHFTVTVHIKTLKDIQKIVKENPFSSFKKSEDTHWYVSLLPSSAKKEIPTFQSDTFEPIALKDEMLFSVFYRNKGKSTDFMTLLDKTYGKEVTTRNWNTFVRISSLK